MFQKFLFIFLFSFSLLVVGCNQSPEIRVIDVGSGDGTGSTDGTSQLPQSVEAIEVGSNTLILKMNEKEDVLTYDLNAVALPRHLKDSKLLYKISKVDVNQDVKFKNKEQDSLLIIDEKGKLSVSELGEYLVEITSEDNPSVKEDVRIIVSKSVNTPLSLDNPMTLLGRYKIEQYGINTSPNRDLHKGSASLNLNILDKNGAVFVGTQLLFNGSLLKLFDSKSDMFTNMTYAEIVNKIVELTDAKVQDSKLIISLKGNTFNELVNKKIIRDDEYLSLSLVKYEDLIPGIELDENKNIMPVDIKVESQFLERNEDSKVKDFDATYDLINGDKFLLNASILPENTGDKTIEFRALNGSIASVNEVGFVTIRKAGLTGESNVARIELSSRKNPSIRMVYKIKIKDTSVQVKSIKFEESVDAIEKGSNATFRAVVEPPNASNQYVKYFTPSTDIIEVDKNGKVTAKKEGVAYLYAFSYNDEVNASKKIVVTNSNGIFDFIASAIYNLPSKLFLQLEKNQSYKLEPIVFPTNIKNKEVEYSIKKGDAVVSVDQSGNIQALSVGEATIEVKSKDNPKIIKEISIDVKPKDYEYVTYKSIEVNESPKNLLINVSNFNLNITTEPSYEKVNHHKKIDVFSTTPNVLEVRPVENNPLAFEIVGIGEGQGILKIQNGNGFEKDMFFNVFRRLKVEGEYEIKQAVIYEGDNELTVTADKFKKFEQEFAIVTDKDSGKLIVNGRFQFTPNSYNELQYFNDKRFHYINKEISLLADNDETYSEKNLKKEDIVFVDDRNLQVTYHESSRNKRIVLDIKKLNDNGKKIKNNQLYVTEIEPDKEIKSLEGYYHVKSFFEKSYRRFFSGVHTYDPIYSHNCDDKNTIHKSIFGADYGNCSMSQLGGGGPGDSVTNFKAEASIIVTGDLENPQIELKIKDQKQGHSSYDNVGTANNNSKYRFFYYDINKFNLNQNQLTSKGSAINATYRNDNIGMRILTDDGSVKTNNGKMYIKPEGGTDLKMQFSVTLDSFDYASCYLFCPTYRYNEDLLISYIFEKKSDVAKHINNSKFSNPAVGDRNPPAYEDHMKVVPATVSEGNCTDIKNY